MRFSCLCGIIALSIVGAVGRRFKDVVTERCLDSTVKGTARGSVHTNPCNGGSHQTWSWGKDRTIKNSATGHCLDSDGKTVYTMHCNGGKYQQWRKDGWGSPINVQTKKCLKGSKLGVVFPQECTAIRRNPWLD